MCSQDPSKRESAASIACRLEWLAAQEDVCINAPHLPQPLRLLRQFHELLSDFHSALQTDSQVNRILRLSSTRATCRCIHAYQRRVRDLSRLLGRTCDDNKRKEFQWSEQHANQLDMFVSEISKSWLVLSGLKSEYDRLTFLATLKSEIENHTSSYTTGQLATMRQAYADISKQTGASVVSTTPAWFVPRYELGEWKWLAEGSFRSLFLAKWFDSEVDVKQVKKASANTTSMWSMPSLMASITQSTRPGTTTETSASRAKREEARRIFEREVDIWFDLSHPHIVRLFGACHVGTPFFLCEYAANGSLDKFIRQHPDQIWPKLLEAALGVQYLHERGVVHGDLKCNNIVVGSDRKAKVTDFGLSTAVNKSDDGSTHKTGAWHWVAPECLADEEARLTFASDIFALGMCIVEALRVVEVSRSNKRKRDSSVPVSTPWLSHYNTVVKCYVTEGKLPSRPRECTDNQWSLVEKMCRFQPSDRIKICTVVDVLSMLAKDGPADNGQTERIADADSDVRPDAVMKVISKVKELVSGHLREAEAASDSRSILYRVHGLLWDRLSHLSGRLDNDLLGSKNFRLLIERAKTKNTEVGKCSDALAQFTEMALRGYALHRRLDKFIAATFVKTDGSDGGDVHAWQPECYEFLGMTIGDEAPGSGQDSVQCA